MRGKGTIGVKFRKVGERAAHYLLFGEQRVARTLRVLEYVRRNPTMASVEKSTAIDPEVLADLEAVCNTKGIVREPNLLRRITERAEQVRRETLEQFGVQEIGAEIIRTMHDPE